MHVPPWREGRQPSRGPRSAASRCLHSGACIPMYLVPKPRGRPARSTWRWLFKPCSNRAGGAGKAPPNAQTHSRTRCLGRTHLQPGVKEAGRPERAARASGGACAGRTLHDYALWTPGPVPNTLKYAPPRCGASVRGAGVRAQRVLDVAVLPVVAKAVGQVPVDRLAQAVLPARLLLPAQRRKLLVADEVAARGAPSTQTTSASSMTLLL